MFFLAFVSLFLCCAASPTTSFTALSFNDTDVDTHRSLDKRSPGGIFITTDINWGGTTGYAIQPFDVCIRLDPPWYHTISSFGPDQGNAAVIYEDYDCNVLGPTINYPGYGNLLDIGWNDRIGSFIVKAV
ncbi:hypothetical protein DBV05_g8942 [Lasiodiplodia theobromae]|uniref:Uncharacterized protein n=1 Tax=Lasiodiplodia theobromae TaxID=45133 RepID=A0A5N5D419_9PEZI|nr:hypothetical protein DBV05_g8942 [Lasiodiplodia theobromae]